MKTAAKQRIMFLIASLLAILGVLLWGAYGARFIRHFHLEPEPKNPLPILMYHNVVEDGVECNSMTVTVGKLREDLNYLFSHGYTPILPKDLTSGDPLPEKPIMITFDDGYKSNYDLLFPILQEYRCKANINVIVYLTNLWSPNYCTWTRLREMTESGFVEIGSHTYKLHNEDGQFDPNGANGIQRRPGESDADYQVRVLDDIQKSYDVLYEELGVAPTCFAYPFGASDRYSIALIHHLFPVTLLTESATADLSKGTHNLPRYTITMSVSLSDILK